MNMPPEDRLPVAAKCGIGEQYLYQVLTRRKVASAELCVAIEQATGGKIGRWHLRPDDWHRIWPELIARPDAPPIPGSSAEPSGAEGGADSGAA